MEGWGVFITEKMVAWFPKESTAKWYAEMFATSNADSWKPGTKATTAPAKIEVR